MIIIGIHGKLHAGKTTLAESMRLLVHPVHGGERIPMAGPLKKTALQMGWNGKKDRKGRRLLQLLGTECGRECIDPNIWVHKWNREVDDLREQGCEIVWADDIRFVNEAENVTNQGGYLIRIFRRPTTIRGKVMAWFRRRWFWPVHESEAGLTGPFDYEYDNTELDGADLDRFAEITLKDILLREREMQMLTK